jgi:hypothetical protein
MFWSLLEVAQVEEDITQQDLHFILALAEALVVYDTCLRRG